MQRQQRGAFVSYALFYQPVIIGYRGLAYVMMERLYITPFGNRLPNLTFEVET